MKKIFSLLLLFAAIVIIGDKSMANEVLTKKQQNIVKISSYTASGDLKNLETAVKQGLDEGLTVNEIKEVMIQLYAYCGFPRSLNALSTLQKAAKEGDYKSGKEGKVLAADADKNEIGEKTQTELVGFPVKGEVYEFAPAIDSFLKEHLFADIFARGVLTNQEREVATIAALSTLDGVAPQLAGHIQIGKNTGLKQEQVDEILKITSSIPKAGPFGLGSENTAYAKYFIGTSYLNPLTTDGVASANVTFEPGCRNNWHIHHKGGQILLVTQGRGYYQEWDKPARELKAGDVVNIPEGVKHWHGAAKDSWFSHIAISVPADGTYTEWLEEVNDKDYGLLK